MNEFQIAINVFKSIFKYVLIFIILNNLVWALLFFGMIHTSESLTTQIQDGTNNHQEMTNG